MLVFLGYVGLYIYLLFQLLLEKHMENISLIYFRSPKFHVQNKIFTNFYTSKHFVENEKERFTPKQSFIFKFGLSPSEKIFFNEICFFISS